MKNDELDVLIIELLDRQSPDSWHFYIGGPDSYEIVLISTTDASIPPNTWKTTLQPVHEFFKTSP